MTLIFLCPELYSLYITHYFAFLQFLLFLGYCPANRGVFFSCSQMQGTLLIFQYYVAPLLTLHHFILSFQKKNFLIHIIIREAFYYL